MVTVPTPPKVSPAHSSPIMRDTGIDLVRALCVLGVVLLHAIMVGVTVGEHGPVFANAGDGAWWIIPVSWLLQVMPLFFVIGGFAGLIAYRRGRERGQTATAFVGARVHRLLRPAVFAIGLAGGGLAALALAGVAPELIAIAGFRYGQPLWFLAVFLLCQALLPALAAAHERAPLTAVGALVTATVAVDVLRATSGIEGLGFLNLAFVWLTLQQLGFLLADGTVDAWSRPLRVLLAAGAVALLLAAFVGGVYSPDLIANINPPTGALLLVGVFQLCLVSLFRVRLAELSRRPRASAFSAFVNRRTMTIYLWHMPVLLAMAGVLALAAMVWGAVLPEPSSALWWLSRPLWLAFALVFTALAALALQRGEMQPAPQPAVHPRRIATAVLVGLASVVLLLVAGTSVLTAAMAVAGLLLALRLSRDAGYALRAARGVSAQPARSQRVADLIGVP